MSLRCSYTEGMFACAPRDGYADVAHIWELPATCHHEAAHAVGMFLFGVPILSVGVCAILEEDWADWGYNENTGLSVAYGGLVRVQGPEAINIDFDYCRTHFKHGVIAALGPAGERRFKHFNQIPLYSIGSSEGDHCAIDQIGKTLECRGRSRFAFQRHVWRHAQRLVDRPDVWQAVGDIASSLHEVALNDLDMMNSRETWAIVDAESVYSACRRAGLRHGQLA